MRIGQQAIIVYVSKIVGSIIGFVGFVFVTNRLGADVIGRYNLAIALAGWASLLAGRTIAQSASKRLSEGEGRDDEYVSAAVALSVVVLGVLLVLLVVFRSWISAYTGLQTVTPVAALVVGLSTVQLLGGLLQGQGNVHILGLLEPVKLFFIRGAQVLSVLAGAGLVGIVYGQAVGLVLATAVGALYVRGALVFPTREYIANIVNFSKYVWSSGVESQGWSSIDIIALGLFVTVSDAFIGGYGVAWTVSGILSVFGTSLSSAMFPEISKAHSSENVTRIAGLVEDALRFSGIVTLPGLVGGLLLADRIVTIFGPDFGIGAAALGPIILGQLLFDYRTQLSSALNATDNARLAMYGSLLLIVLNVGLNLLFIDTFGGIGAAYATVLSVFIALLVSYAYCRRVIQFSVPIRDIGTQVLASLVMGAIVFWVEGYIPMGEPAVGRALYTVVIIVIGAVVYVSVLYATSQTVRRKLADNVPF